MERVVCAGAGDHRRAVADGIDRGSEELELLVVRQRGALARRPGDDDPVRAVVDEVGRELPEPLHVDRPVRVERRDHGGEDFTEHAWILRARETKATPFS